MYNIDLGVKGKYWWMNVYLCCIDLGVGEGDDEWMVSFDWLVGRKYII